jgi:cell division protein FtsI/penicillin-binding protein 2
MASDAASPFTETARYIARELMVSVVENGSGKGAKLDHYQVEGKTGTTKLMGRGTKVYEAGAYQGAFVGAAPMGREELVALVMIRRPNARIAYYGSAIAAPVVGQILGQALPYVGVPPDKQLASTGP